MIILSETEDMFLNIVIYLNRQYRPDMLNEAYRFYLVFD